MAVFNPDVPAVGIPDDNNITRAPSQVQGNKGAAILGETIGKGLGALGDLYRDTTKVVDYTNKNFLENDIAVKTNRIRDDQIADTLDRVKVAQGRLSADATESSSDQSEGQPPFQPDVLKRQANTLARAREENTQSDLWYKARLDLLAKAYRSEHPQYRDYIDKIFEKQGFGNTANNVLHAAQQEFLRLQANTSDETKNQLHWILERNKYDPEYAAKAYKSVAAGDPNAFTNAQLHLGGIEKNKLDVEAAEAKLKLRGVTNQNIQEEYSELGNTYARNVVATTLFNNNQEEGLNTLAGINRYTQRIARGEPISDDAMVQAQATAKVAIQNVENQFEAWGNEPTQFKDSLGNIKSGTRVNLMGRENWANIKKEALEPLRKIVSNISEGNMPLAHFQAQMVQAYKENFASGVFHNPTLAGSLAAADFFKNFPGWDQVFVSSILSDPNVARFRPEVAGVVMDWTMSMFGPNPPAVKEGIDAIKKQWGDKPAANKAIVEGTIKRVIDPTTPPEVAKNGMHSLFQEKNYGITEKMSPDDRANKFRDMTSEAVAKRAKTLGPSTVREWSDWAVNEFSQVLLKKEINDLPEIEQNKKVTIGFDTERNRFTLSSGGNHQLETWAPARLRLLGTGVDPYAIEQYAKTVNRLNDGLGGIQHVAETRGEDPTAFLINSMKAGGHTDNKFWDSLKQHSEQLKRDAQTKKIPPVNAP